MDLPEMETGTAPIGLDNNYPGAAEQEARLLKTIESKTHADLHVVRKTVDLIKKYHASAKRKTGEPFYLHGLWSTVSHERYDR